MLVAHDLVGERRQPCSEVVRHVCGHRQGLRRAPPVGVSGWRWVRRSADVFCRILEDRRCRHLQIKRPEFLKGCGVVLVFAKDGEKFFVQCKQWKAYKVGVDVVRELYGVMAAKGATSGFVVTSGRFTNDAKDFADGRNVQLVDGTKLFALIKQVKLSHATKQSATNTLLQSDNPVASEPTCPQCGSSMVKRTARKGGNADGDFWGCSKFPICRGVRPLE